MYQIRTTKYLSADSHFIDAAEIVGLSSPNPNFATDYTTDYDHGSYAAVIPVRTGEDWNYYGSF